MKKWICGSVASTLITLASVAHASVAPVRVPEIDPAGAVTAITFLAGVVAIVMERRGRK